MGHDCLCLYRKGASDGVKPKEQVGHVCAFPTCHFSSPNPSASFLATGFCEFGERKAFGTLYEGEQLKKEMQLGIEH